MPIKIMSAPRSGSTFILQIFKHIFKNVEMRHDEHYGNTANVIIFRSFLDSAMSLYRVKYGIKNDFVITDIKVLNKVIENYNKYSEAIIWYVSRDYRALYFIYEYDIKTLEGNNYHKIFNMIEDHFNIKMDNKLRSNIMLDTNLDVNKSRSSLYDSFGIWNKETMIHGNHVNNGNVGMWKSHLSEDLHQYYSDSKLNTDYQYCINKLYKNSIKVT